MTNNNINFGIIVVESHLKISNILNGDLIIKLQLLNAKSHQ